MKTYKKILKLITILFVLITMQSCYKIKNKSSIKGTVTCLDINDVGVSGVEFRVTEQKHKYGNPTTFMIIETDENGVANYEFNPPSTHKKWHYTITFDNSTLPLGFHSQYKGEFNKNLKVINIPNENFNENDVVIHLYPN